MSSGGATGREGSIRPRRPQSGVQSNEVARTEPVLNNANCGDLGVVQHDGQARKRELKPGENETWSASGSAGESSDLYCSARHELERFRAFWGLLGWFEFDFPKSNIPIKNSVV